VRGTSSNAVEMGVAVGEAEIGRVSQACGFVVGRAFLLCERGRFVDPVDRVIADRYRRRRVLHNRRPGAGGEEHEGCNAGPPLLPEPDTAYLCPMTHTAKNLLAGH